MTTTLSARRLGSFWMPLFLGLFLAGCASPPEKPEVNWDSRVGNYTFDQAKAELGAPNQLKPLPEGGNVAEWVTRQNVGNRGMETGPRAGGVDQPTGQVLTSLPKTEYLVLTFDAGGKLAKWQRVLR